MPGVTVPKLRALGAPNENTVAMSAEAEIEPVFAQHKDSPEMKAMGRKFGQVSPAVGGRFFAWVMNGATPEEQAAITENVPKPVLMIIGGIFGRGYRRDVAPVVLEHFGLNER